MNSQNILIAACSEAAETWHYMSRECDAFNKDLGLETAGQVTRSLLTFGTSALVGIPEIKRRIEGHIIRLEKSLYELQKRVSRCVALAGEDDNIYKLLLQVERKRFGASNLLTCGFLEDDSKSEYRCNIGEVSFHLIEARSFYGSAKNPVQDVAIRHKMACRSMRFLEPRSQTPKLASMPHTPLSKKLKDYINSQIEAQVGIVDDLASSALSSIKEAGKKSHLLQKILTPDNINSLKRNIEEHASRSCSASSSRVDIGFPEDISENRSAQAVPRGLEEVLEANIDNSQDIYDGDYDDDGMIDAVD